MGKMDAAARERLAKAKAERDKLKGRNSLRGLDAAGWAASLDAVLNGDVVCPSVVEPRDDGSVSQKKIALDEWRAGNRVTPDFTEFRRTYEGDREDSACHVDYTKFLARVRDSRERVSFVRVMQARRQMIEDLSRAFPVRYLSLLMWHREVSAYVNDKVPIFRAADIVAVFAAIWPEPLLGGSPNVSPLRKWQAMTGKYLRGYSAQTAEELAWIDYAKPPTCGN